MKTIIFNQILSVVEEATEIPRVRILSREKQREVVDARSLLFHYLYAQKFTKSQISRLTGHTRQCVSLLVEQFEDRKDVNGNIMSITMKQIDNMLSSK